MRTNLVQIFRRRSKGHFLSFILSIPLSHPLSFSLPCLLCFTLSPPVSHDFFFFSVSHSSPSPPSHALLSLPLPFFFPFSLSPPLSLSSSVSLSAATTADAMSSRQAPHFLPDTSGGAIQMNSLQQCPDWIKLLSGARAADKSSPAAGGTPRITITYGPGRAAVTAREHGGERRRGEQAGSPTA